MPHTRLSGQRILILEDDYLDATETAKMLRAAGAVVLGPRAAEGAAFEDILDDTPTVAVLDIYLAGKASFEVARVLRDSDIPFVFLSAYAPSIVPTDLAGQLHLTKPVTEGVLVKALQQASA